MPDESAVCQCDPAVTEVHAIIGMQPHPLLSSFANALEAFDRGPFVYLIIWVDVFVFCLPQGIFHFQLGRGEPMLHTRLRPHCKEFLEKIAELYELHVFTFGSRLYAHTIAGNSIIDIFFFHLCSTCTGCLCPQGGSICSGFPFSSSSLQEHVGIKCMSAAGIIFNVFTFNTDIKFNLSLSGWFLIIATAC